MFKRVLCRWFVKPVFVPRQFTLLSEESDLFRRLLTAAEKHAVGTTVRVSGGWVRDKILGVP
jgi:hypothetical protein